VRTCVLCGWCLLRCLDTSSNTGGRPDASSGSSVGNKKIDFAELYHAQNLLTTGKLPF
jgi:hypothetical protein